jgi:L-amino acid N-acyltransferase YncA
VLQRHGRRKLLLLQQPAVLMNASVAIRRASRDDLERIRRIYNEGIEDRVATLDILPRSDEAIMQWWSQHDQRYAILVALERGEIAGWASLNRFSHRCAHSEIADLSVYVAREHRNKGVGCSLLSALLNEARNSAFHKIVLHALAENEFGKQLYLKVGFVEVGVFKQHGLLDGKYVDVVAMERLL